MEDMARDPTRGWGFAARRYIQLICSHLNAIRSLIFSEHEKDRNVAMKKYLNRLSLNIIDVQPQWADQVMIPFDEVLENLDLQSGDLLQFKDWITNRPFFEDEKARWEKPIFTGSLHCETILLSLHALSLPFDSTSQSAPAIERIQHALRQIADIPSEVINLLRIRGNRLTMSKPCCPACNTLCFLIRRQSGKPFRYPSSHTAWYPVSLPPWIPRHLGMQMMSHAKKELVERILNIVDRLQRSHNSRKRSASDASAGPQHDIDREKRARIYAEAL
ncbi:MAG: hypothetical protein Q9174_006026 [Haloplaca sp. 1 TL-2023]